MKTVYIDSDYKCHLENDGSMTAVQTDVFDDKCDEYVEGFRFVPDGATWVRDDGAVFHGELVTAWRKYSELAEIQTAVDRTQHEADEELAALIEEIYQEDLAIMEE